MSRGAAALLAIDKLEDLDVGGSSVVIEAVEEPSSIAGRRSPEMNLVGIEPWIVFLVAPDRATRYIIAVAPDGQIVDNMVVPMSETEMAYYPVAE